MYVHLVIPPYPHHLGNAPDAYAFPKTGQPSANAITKCNPDKIAGAQKRYNKDQQIQR